MLMVVSPQSYPYAISSIHSSHLLHSFIRPFPSCNLEPGHFFGSAHWRKPAPWGVSKSLGGGLLGAENPGDAILLAWQAHRVRTLWCSDVKEMAGPGHWEG